MLDLRAARDLSYNQAVINALGSSAGSVQKQIVKFQSATIKARLAIGNPSKTNATMSKALAKALSAGDKAEQTTQQAMGL